MTISINVDQYYDDANRGINETIYLENGAKLTFRTDTRWYANAPTGADAMKGSIYSLSSYANHIGHIFMDGTKVRWMSYDGGTGNVPTIGTIITQGGVSGYLLGVWENFASAPTAVGAAMPASGFLKFREVTNGPFEVGSLTGIGASATEPDEPGWIEIVFSYSSSYDMLKYGGSLIIDGDMFQIGVSTGEYEQVVQAPTNGGGDNTQLHGVFIEKTPGSEDYAYWPKGEGSIWNEWIGGSAYKDTDDRQNFVKGLNNGRVQLGEHVTYASTYSASMATVQATATDGTVVLKLNNPSSYYATGEVVYVDFQSPYDAYKGAYPIIASDKDIYINVPGIPDFTNVPTLYMAYCQITRNNNYLAKGTEVYVEFNNHLAFNGKYRIVYTSSDYYYIVVPFIANASGDSTEKFTIGNIPPVGCKIKIPNVILHRTTSSDYTKNIDMTDSYKTTVRFSSCRSLPIISLKNVCACGVNFTITQSESLYAQNSSFYHDTEFSSQGDIAVKNCGFSKINIFSKNVAFEDSVLSGIIRTESSYVKTINFLRCFFCNGSINFDHMESIKFIECKFVKNDLNFWYSNRVTIADCNYSSRIAGRTGDTHTVTTMITCKYSNNIVINNLNIICFPVTKCFDFAQSVNIDIKNIGTRESPLVWEDCRYGYGRYFISSEFIVGHINLSRIYIKDYGKNVIYGVNSTNSYAYIKLRDVYIFSRLYGFAVSKNIMYRGLGCSSVSGEMYGGDSIKWNWHNMFASDTTGSINLYLWKPDSDSKELESFSTKTFTLFGNESSYRGIVLNNVYDTCTWVMSYYALGYTGFANKAMTTRGQNVGNLKIEYQLDPGTGVFSPWKDCTPTNLSAETISPSLGFKLKIRFTAVAYSVGNSLEYIFIPMVTTAQAQAENLYPLDEPDEVFNIYAPELSKTLAYPHTIECNLSSSVDGSVNVTSNNPLATVPATVEVKKGECVFNVIFTEPCSTNVSVTLDALTDSTEIESDYYPELLAIGPDYNSEVRIFPTTIKINVASNIKWNQELSLNVNDTNIDADSVTLVDGIGSVDVTILGPCDGTIEITTPLGTTESCVINITDPPVIVRCGPSQIVRAKLP